MSIRRKILAVDNAQMMHNLIKVHLAKEPVDIVCTLSGDGAVDLARREHPDLILLDVQMPDPDGWEVCRLLKADGDTRNIPVIFLTAEDNTAQKIRGLDLGAVDYITKPFDPAELLARVRSALRMKEMIDLLSERAMIDGMTGLWNRAYLDQRLAAELNTAARHGTPLSCVLADVDHFKSFNDRHGHAVGDTVLRHTAEVLRSAARTEDVVCRYGGEEFCILLPNVPATQAAAYAERARAALAGQPMPSRQGDLSVTASFGVADLETAACGAAQPGLLASADAALYAAKRAGRNRTHTAAGPVDANILVAA